MSRQARGLRGQTGNGQVRQALPHGRQAASADRLRARIKGSGDSEKAKIAMSRQGRGLRGRTDGRVGTGNPAAERRDSLCILIAYIHKNVARIQLFILH